MGQAQEPEYRLLESHFGIQIREYPQTIVAQVVVEGERQLAIRQGFRLLAGYIFGGNSQGQAIAMTKPVMQQPHFQNDLALWTVRFFMPPNYRLEDLPAAKDSRIEIVTLPPTRYLVIRFSGTPNEKKIQKYLHKLQTYVTSKSFNMKEAPIYAFYNPPWTLPFLRRNEIMWMFKDKKN